MNKPAIDALDARILLALDEDPTASVLALARTLGVARNTQTKGGAADAGLFTIPEVVEVHSTTGDADLVAKVLAKDTADLHRITRDILAVEGVERTSTVISLLEVMPLRMEALLKRLASGEAQR